MLRIRLSRVGKRKQPSYRIVVADSRSPRDGSFVEIIGHYNPRTDPTTLVVKEEEAIDWLRRGAQPSDTAAKLLTRIGVMERAGRAPVVWDRETPVRPKKVAAEAPAAAPAAAAAPTAASTEVAAATEEETPAEAEAAAEQPAAEAEPTSGETEAAAAAEEEQPEPEPEATKPDEEAEGESSEEREATE